MNGVLNQLNKLDPAIPFSKTFNIEDVPARITLILLANILLSFLHASFIQRLSFTLQHFLNGLFGLVAMYYCFGTQTWHVIADVILFITLIKTVGGSFISVVISWITIFPHLLYGYHQIIMAETDTRTVFWTIPHCVLTLKLIGLSQDIFDTKQSRVKTEIKSAPELETDEVTISEVFGFAFFYPTSLVGPQIQFRRYKDFVEGKLYDRNVIKHDFVYGLLRFAAGVGAGLFYSSLVRYVPIDYLVTAEFASHPLYYKLGYTALRHLIALKQYYTVWLFSETSCVITGISFKSRNDDGSVDWSACAGIKLVRLEAAYNAYTIIDTFNVTTNQWALKYVYKRCKFLGNKTWSQLITLSFISAWHGFYFGYYLCTFLEIPILYLEDLATSFMFKTPLSKQKLPTRAYMFLMGVAYRYLTVSIPFTFFQLLTWDRCWTFSKAMNHCIFIEYLILIPVFIVLAFINKKRRKHLKTKINNE